MIFEIIVYILFIVLLFVGGIYFIKLILDDKKNKGKSISVQIRSISGEIIEPEQSVQDMSMNNDVDYYSQPQAQKNTFHTKQHSKRNFAFIGKSVILLSALVVGFTFRHDIKEKFHKFQSSSDTDNTCCLTTTSKCFQVVSGVCWYKVEIRDMKGLPVVG